MHSHNVLILLASCQQICMIYTIAVCKRGWSPGRKKGGFSLLRSVQRASGAPPTSYSVVTDVIFTEGLKRTMHDPRATLPPVVEVKIARWYLIKS